MFSMNRLKTEREEYLRTEQVRAVHLMDEKINLHKSRCAESLKESYMMTGKLTDLFGSCSGIFYLYPSDETLDFLRSKYTDIQFESGIQVPDRNHHVTNHHVSYDMTNYVQNHS